jgi:hypothetical protein
MNQQTNLITKPLKSSVPYKTHTLIISNSVVCTYGSYIVLTVISDYFLKQR